MATVAAMRTRFVSVLLAGVHDPHNVAAVLRSADAFGVQDVHAVEAPERLRISNRVARGAARWVDLFRYPAVDVALDFLIARGYAIWAADAGAKSVDLAAWTPAQPTVFVFGNEHRGVGDTVRARAHVTFAIPMVGMVESLNVSVACSLTLHHARAQLAACGRDFVLPQAEQAELIRRWTQRKQREAA